VELFDIANPQPGTGIVGYPRVHYSAMLRYVWSVTEESTVVADDDCQVREQHSGFLAQL